MSVSLICEVTALLWDADSWNHGKVQTAFHNKFGSYPFKNNSILSCKNKVRWCMMEFNKIRLIRKRYSFLTFSLLLRSHFSIWWLPQLLDYVGYTATYIDGRCISKFASDCYYLGNKQYEHWSDCSNLGTCRLQYRLSKYLSRRETRRYLFLVVVKS